MPVRAGQNLNLSDPRMLLSAVSWRSLLHMAFLSRLTLIMVQTWDQRKWKNSSPPMIFTTASNAMHILACRSKCYSCMNQWMGKPIMTAPVEGRDWKKGLDSFRQKYRITTQHTHDAGLEYPLRRVCSVVMFGRRFQLQIWWIRGPTKLPCPRLKMQCSSTLQKESVFTIVCWRRLHGST